jgi:hypothetical protein
MCRFPAGGGDLRGGGEHSARFAFLRFPDEPVEPVEGWAEIAGNEARNPRIDVRNLSSRQVRSVEIDWIVTDRQGKQYMAGSVPASGPEFNLKAGSTSRVLQDTALRFAHLSKDGGAPVSVSGHDGFRRPGGICRRQGLDSQPRIARQRPASGHSGSRRPKSSA